MADETHITVLMSTYNGEQFLREQIESIICQKGVDVHLVVRDDGSRDHTIDILREYQSKGALEWYSGKNLKTARSFLNLVSRARDDDYYAFSDQDDVWFDQKLKRAISLLKRINVDSPVLYTGNYILADKNLNRLNGERHITTTTLANAIVCSCCTGCTMVFNKQLRNLIKRHVYPLNIYMHDDWIHKLCLAVGGKVIYDNKPMMFYRQHGGNVDGGVHSFRDKLGKVINDKKKKKHLMSMQLQEILNFYKDIIPRDNKLLMEKALRLGQGNLINRFILATSDVYKIKSNTNLNNEFRLSLLLNYW